MSRFPRLAVSDWSSDFGADDLDIGHIRSIFSSPPEEVCVFIDGTSGTKYEDESSDDYWGTEEGWEQLERDAMSAEEFDRISAYLDETGHTSA